jgi:hypothetical protein
MTEAAQEVIRQPWEQMDGESNVWFGRFQLYLGLGPMRTLISTPAAVSKQTGKSCSYNPEWGRHSRIWRWRERAQAWDAHQRDLLAVAERNSRAALKSRRLDVIGDYLDVVRGVLDNANLEEADQQQSRQWLPQMRQFLLELLEAERKECEGPEYTRNDPLNAAPITADDLRAAQRALDGEASTPTQVQSARAHPLQPRAVPLIPSAQAYFEARHCLLVCIGPDPALALDLAVLRKVRAATGLQFKRLVDLTRQKFARTLRRERNLGRPVKLVHMAVHASAAGVQFADGIVDGGWLSKRLDGVQVLLLAACDSDSIGDWLGVVPYVVTFGEALGSEDAAVLAQHFWHNIALDKDPGEALDEALTYCPPVVSEYVVRHW